MRVVFTALTPTVVDVFDRDVDRGSEERHPLMSCGPRCAPLPSPSAPACTQNLQVVFTALTPIVVGVFDRDVDRGSEERYPVLYLQGTDSGREGAVKADIFREAVRCGGTWGRRRAVGTRGDALLGHGDEE